MEMKVFHADHGLGPDHFNKIREVIAEEKGFFIKVIPLNGLPPLSSALYGPSVGDSAVTDDEARFIVRGDRASPSRMVRRPMKIATHLVAIGMFNEKDNNFLLFTAYGTTNAIVAPREPWDKGLTDEERRSSEAFWSVHALAY